MLSALIAPFREAPDAPRLQDPAQVATLYQRRRRQVLLASMVGYAMFYFCRKNISIAMPGMSETLGYTNAELGVLGSTLYITYGVGKFLSGLVADRASPRVFMTAGLLLSVLCCLAFGASSSLFALALLWGLNGAFQSTGAPASAKVVATWFSANERGAMTGIWNISHQAGGGLVLIVAGFIAEAYGWRGAMIGTAVIAAVGGLLVAPFLHDRPESHGLPPIEEHRADPVAAEEAARDVPFAKLVIQRVLLNPHLWLVALGSAATYVARYGALDWSPKYLVEQHGAEVGHAGVSTSLLELLGIPGALFCGWLSDRLGARRAPVAFGSLVLLGLSIEAFRLVPAGNPGLDRFLLGVVGFCTYGPQLLLAGVAPVDVSSRRVAAAAVGFTGLMSYAGATLASAGTGYLIDRTGWDGAFHFWSGAAFFGALVCVPMWRRRAGQ